MTWVGILNVLFFQFLFVRLTRTYTHDSTYLDGPFTRQEIYGYRFMVGVVPFTGWNGSRYRYVIPLKYIYTPYIWKLK